MRHRDKPFRRMRKTGNETDIRKYKDCKRNAQKYERQSYWSYVNRIIEVVDQEDEPVKTKAILELYQVPSQKFNRNCCGRLFNTSKDEADILNRQYLSTFTREDEHSAVPSPFWTPSALSVFFRQRTGKDFSKAFDRVPHRRLLRKLHHYGIRGNLHSWTTSFLTGRAQKVVVEDQDLKVYQLSAAIPRTPSWSLIIFPPGQD